MTLEGQFQIYTGDGKGKTTAALGLAVRAAGAGMRVYIGQFIKDQEYHEVPLLRRLGVVVELYGTGKGCLIGKHPAQEDLDAAADGLKKAQAALQSGQYDLVILDEINVAWQLGLLQETQLEQLAKLRPQPVELVYTGRGCPRTAGSARGRCRNAGVHRAVYQGPGVPRGAAAAQAGCCCGAVWDRQGMSDWKASGTGGFGCSGRRTEKGAGCPAKRAVRSGHFG